MRPFVLSDSGGISASRGKICPMPPRLRRDCETIPCASSQPLPKPPQKRWNFDKTPEFSHLCLSPRERMVAGKSLPQFGSQPSATGCVAQYGRPRCEPLRSIRGRLSVSAATCRLEHPANPQSAVGCSGWGDQGLPPEQLMPRLQALLLRRASRTSNGRPGSSFAQRMTRLVFTLATLSAAVSSAVRKL